MNNQELQAVYERAYAGGKEHFFTLPTADVTAEVLKELDWAGRHVLEVGCGTGYTAYMLAMAGATVTAVDYAPTAIREARASFVHPNLHFQVGAFGDVEGNFDAVVLQEVVEHLDDPLATLRELVPRLRPAGVMVITCPSFLNLRGHVWMTLQLLLDVPMSLTDRHFLSPFDFEAWARELGMTCDWHTFRYGQAHGSDLIADFDKRLRNALRDARLDASRVDRLLEWLNRVRVYEADQSYNGAKALYRLVRPQGAGTTLS